MNAVPFFRIELACEVINAFLAEHKVAARPPLTPQHLVKYFRRRKEADWTPRGLVHKLWVKDEAEHHNGKLIVVNIEMHPGYADLKEERRLKAELNRRILEATDGRWDEPIKHTHVPDDRLQAACLVINQYLHEHGVGEDQYWNPDSVRAGWDADIYGCRYSQSPAYSLIAEIQLLKNQVMHNGQIVAVFPGPESALDARMMTLDLRPRVLSAIGGLWEDPVFEDESLNSPSS